MRTLLFIVEDDPVTLRSFGRELGLHKIPYVFAKTLAEAEAVWREHANEIALIAMDGNLNGELTMRFIRDSLRPNFDGQIISITGNLDLVKPMFAAGCDVHIVKNEALAPLIAMMMRHSNSLPPSSSCTD